MKNLLGRILFLTALLPLCLSAAPSTPVGTPIKLTFDNSFPVPAGAKSMVVELRGGNGGSGVNAGQGRSFTATFAVTERQPVTISSSKNGSGAWKVAGDFGWAIAGQGGAPGSASSGGKAGAVNAPKSGSTGGQGEGGNGDTNTGLANTNGNWVVSTGAGSGYKSDGGTAGQQGQSGGAGVLTLGSGGGGDGWGGGGGGAQTATITYGYVAMSGTGTIPGVKMSSGGGGSGVTGTNDYIDNYAPHLTDADLSVPWAGGVYIAFFTDGTLDPDRPTAAITPTPAIIVLGASSTLSATYTADTAKGDSLTSTAIECTTYTVSNDLPIDAPSRTSAVTPSAVGIYTFEASASTSYYKQKQSCASCKVTVLTSATDVGAWINASPLTATAPYNGFLSWGSTNATSVSVTGPGVSSAADNEPALPLNLPTPGTYTYTVTATQGTQTATDSVTVTVTPAAYTLTTSVTGLGTVTGGGSFPANTQVGVTATPNAGQTFLGWTGDTSLPTGSAAITQPSLIVRMNQNRDILAKFTNSTGTTPQVITFDDPGTHDLSEGSVVLNAYADPGHRPVTLTVISGPGTLLGNVLTFSAGGDILIEASHPGDATYLPATPVRQIAHVGGAAKVSVKLQKPGINLLQKASGNSNFEIKN